MSTRKEISLENRDLIVKLWKERKSYGEIAKIIGISRASVQTVIKNYNLRGTIMNKYRSGRPRKLNDRETSVLLQKVQDNPHLSAPELTIEIERITKKSLHTDTVRRLLRNAGFNRRASNSRTLMSEQSSQNKLDYLNKFLVKDQEFSKLMDFINESEFDVYGSDNREEIHPNTVEEIQPNAGEEMVSENIVLTITYETWNFHPVEHRWSKLDSRTYPIRGQTNGKSTLTSTSGCDLSLMLMGNE